MKDPLKTLGATNHTPENYERSSLDYYGTDPKSTEALMNCETFNHKIWEPAAGHNLIVNVLRDHGYEVRTSDIFDYGYGAEIMNFLEDAEPDSWDGDIVMNPPYYDAEKFVTKALEVVKPGAKVAVFLKVLFLEGQGRYERLFSVNPPKRVHVFSGRQTCSKVDDFTVGSAVAYCWMVWEKGFTGDPVIKWIH